MGEEERSKIHELELELENVPELPEEKPKSLQQQIDEVAAEITAFGKKRSELSGKEIDEFDRIRFRMTKERLERQLERLLKLANERKAVVK